MLPLHIFEERYKVLINECTKGKKEFGINLVDGQKFCPIGCKASVTQVLQRYDDGRLDIVVQGGDRYTLLRYQDDLAPYLVGFIEKFRDSNVQVDNELARDTVELYNRLVAAAYKDKLQPVPAQVGAEGISFRLAQKAGMSLRQRQELLELGSENDRLRLVHKYLTEVIPRLEDLEELDRIIKSDGYI
jgi:Lon protease-like protein